MRASRPTAAPSRSSPTGGCWSRRSPTRPKEAKDRLDCDQLFLLPLDGGEARRLTDLPRGVNDFAWSPDGRSLAVLSSSLGATADEEAKKRGRPATPKPGETPLSDYRYIDRLNYQYNGARLHRRPRRAPVAGRRDDRRGALAGRRSHARGRARMEPRRHPDRLHGQSPTERGPRRAVVGVRGRGGDGRCHDDRRRRRRRVLRTRPGPRTATSILALGDRFPRAGYRTGIWRFAADGSDAGRGGGTGPARRRASSSRTPP